jgi:hypothetical protein
MMKRAVKAYEFSDDNETAAFSVDPFHFGGSRSDAVMTGLEHMRKRWNIFLHV